MQLVLIISKVVSFNPDHGEMGYWIQFVSDMRQVWFSAGTPPIKLTTDYHDIAELLFKVALNTVYIEKISNI
jgi:hypothetical protein